MQSHSPAYVLIWEFRVRSGHESEFERVYGPQGDWALFFAQDPDYLGTELLRDAETPRRYLTIDRWASREAYENFRREHAAEYRALDQRCEEFTESETPLGVFARIGEPFPR